MSTATTDQTQAALEALKAEFPDQAILISVGNATGQFSFSTNMNTGLAAAHLDHIAQHLRGECKC